MCVVAYVCVLHVCECVHCCFISTILLDKTKKGLVKEICLAKLEDCTQHFSVVIPNKASKVAPISSK